jgi:diguanylate cyclase (GGDEF)-like protein
VFPYHHQHLSDAVAKELPNQVEAESHTLKGMLLNLVTMSMGVHQTPNWGVQTVEELLHEVDSAMYAAKAVGRNRISFTKADISSDADHLAPKKAEQSLR